MERFWRQVDRSGDGCWEWQATRNRKGYGEFGWKGRVWMAHHIAYMIENGLVDSDLFICHHCDNPPCVRPSHLYLGDAHLNARDMILRSRGGQMKVGTEQVRALRAEYAAGGVSQQSLGDRYGLSQGQVSRIIRGERWAVVQ